MVYEAHLNFKATIKKQTNRATQVAKAEAGTQS